MGQAEPKVRGRLVREPAKQGARCLCGSEGLTARRNL